MNIHEERVKMRISSKALSAAENQGKIKAVSTEFMLSVSNNLH